MLTPKLSMRRAVIVKTYSHLIDAMYNQSGGVEIGAFTAKRKDDLSI